MNRLQSLLYRSFDEELTTQEKIELEKGLIESEDLRKEKASIEKMRAMVSSSEFHFENGFADKIMVEIEQPISSQDIQFYKLFQRIALSGVAAIILFLISIYFVDGSLNLDSIFGLTEYTPDNAELSFFNLDEFE